MPGDAKTQTPKLVEGVVAPRRTVAAPSDERQVVGYADDGTPKFRFVDKHYGPGETVTLPEDDVKRLRRAGFLVDPDTKAVPVDIGPTFKTEDV